jgi:hemoglobin
MSIIEKPARLTPQDCRRTMSSETARRTTLSDDISRQTGITDEMIGRLVETFYGRVRQDAVLADLFARVENWDEHLARLRDFWSSVTLMTGRYHGRPMQAHFPLPLAPQHFDRWLMLFEQTTADVCPPQAAAVFMEKARRIADSFEMAMATKTGEIVSPRHSIPTRRPASAT